MKRQCPQCLAILPPKARLCSRCGVTLPEPSAPLVAPEAVEVVPAVGPAEPSAVAPASLAVAAQPMAEPAALVPAASADGLGFGARLRRAFAVTRDLGSALGEAATLETAHQRAVALVGEAAWNAGLVPVAAGPAAEQVRRLDADADELARRVAEIEGLLAAHDGSAGALEAEAAQSLAANRVAAAEAVELRDATAREVKELEREAAALSKEVSRAEAAGRAAREEAEGLGHSDITAEERIKREAELERARIAAEQAALEARRRAVPLAESVEGRREALQAAEQAVADRAAERAGIEEDLATRREETARAGADLATRLAEARARAEALARDRSKLLAAVGGVVAVERPRHEALDPLYGELEALASRLEQARGRAAELERESGRLRTLRIAAVAVGAFLLGFVIVLIAFVYSSR